MLDTMTNCFFCGGEHDISAPCAQFQDALARVKDQNEKCSKDDYCLFRDDSVDIKCCDCYLSNYGRDCRNHRI
jgi:hypothetical protein